MLAILIAIITMFFAVKKSWDFESQISGQLGVISLLFFGFGGLNFNYQWIDLSFDAVTKSLA